MALTKEQEQELRRQYMQSRGKKAAAGAATGAAAGTAIMPGVGSAIGAGLGGIAGWISGGPSEAERLRDEQLAELMRLEELNALGLDPKVEALKRQELQGSGDMREMRLNRMAEQGITGGGGAAKEFQAMMDFEAKRKAGIEQQIMKENIIKEQEQRAEIARLQGQQLEEQQQDNEEMYNALVSAMTDVGMAGEFDSMFGSRSKVKSREELAAKMDEYDKESYKLLMNEGWE